MNPGLGHFSDLANWSHRAIVPATEYYQRRTIGQPALRYAISRRDGQPMALAGLWAAFRHPGGEIVRTYCIITVPAMGAVAEIHDRMPLVLDDRDWAVWLGDAAGDPTTLLRAAPNASGASILTPWSLSAPSGDAGGP